MKVKLALLAGLIVLGAVGAHVIEGFKNSPTGQVIEQIQEKKQLIAVSYTHLRAHET